MTRAGNTWEGFLGAMKRSGEIDLYHEISGEGRETLLLLHGFGQNRYTWRHIAPVLGRGRRVVAADLKGFGRSPKPRDGAYGVYEQARCVLRLIRRLDLRELTLAGHSFGGGVSLITALYLALHEPGRLRGLILLDSPAYAQTLPPFVSLLNLPFIGTIGASLVPAELQIRAVLRLSYADPSLITGETVAAYTAPLRAPGGLEALVETARQMVPDDLEGLSLMYPRIDLPALILWGEEDKIIPLKIGERLSRDLPRSALRLFPRCGHVPQEEVPLETLAAMEAFLRHPAPD